jgi:hypothetical protein
MKSMSLLWTAPPPARECPGYWCFTPRCDKTYHAEIPTGQNALEPTGAMTEPYPARLAVRARSE